MRTIYNGGFLPELAIDDSKNSRYWGWLMAKNPADGQWVSIANLSLQITNAVMEGDPTEIETLRAQVAALSGKAPHGDMLVHLSANYLRELQAQLADCRAVLRAREHADLCPATRCHCGGIESAWWHDKDHPHFAHKYHPDKCSDACGYARVMGEG